MENKKYLDKVLGYVVKGTKMDYENKDVNTPFIYTLKSPPSSLPFLSPYFCSTRPPLRPALRHCSSLRSSPLRVRRLRTRRHPRHPPRPRRPRFRNPPPRRRLAGPPRRTCRAPRACAGRPAC